MNGRPTSSPMIRALAVLTLATSTWGCTASAVDVAPPRYELYFPTGMALSPDERYLFVVSANSDLRYSSGALHTIDLTKVDDIVQAGAGAGCKPIPGRPTVLGCPMHDGDAPASFMVQKGGVELGNFAVSVAVQPLADSKNLRVFTTVRGDPSVTWADFNPDAGTLDCGGQGDFTRCTDTHRLTHVRNDLAFPNLPPEPFNMAIAGDHLLVTHFTSGYVSLVSAPPSASAEPILQDTITTLWVASRITGLSGAAGVAPRPNDPSGLFYVTSRQEARVAMVGVAEGGLDIKDRPTEALVRSQWFFLNGLESPGLPGDARAIAFNSDGSRAYLTARTPPSMQVFDTTLGPTGAPRNTQVGAIEVCAQPANLAVADFGAGPRVAVPCFTDGQVWIIDGATLRLISVEDAGRGPTGVVASPLHKKIFIGNYAEDTITVIDAAPGSSTEHRAVLRLGDPRPLEGN